MKVIRRNVFETNSSSTHSISIYRWTPSKESPIPRNTSIDIIGEVSAQTEIKDEMGKLKYIICMLASILEHNYEDENDDYLSFDEMINHNYFIWLKDIIKDKCNTEINYITDCDNYFPYYETVYDDNYSITSILGFDVNNEKLFKEKISKIIFDENMIIEDKENEY